MKYKFENFNLEITDPIITISADNISIFPSNMTIDVDILLTVTNAKYGVRLTDVQVQNLNYDEGTLQTRVLLRLKDFEV
jgi:hypothetical protein